MARRFNDEVIDDLVTRPVLMLLATRMQIAGSDGGERQRPAALFAQTLGQELIVPQADGFQLLGPNAEHAGSLAEFLRQQIIDAGVLQDRIALERLIQKAF